MNEEDFPIIFSYSRAQALMDGVLVDLTAWAKPLAVPMRICVVQLD